MNNQFDELTKNLTPYITRRWALKKLALHPALTCVALLFTCNSINVADIRADTGTTVDPAPVNQPVSPPCAALNGTFVATLFEFTGPTTARAEGYFLIEGEIAGTWKAAYFNIGAHGNGVTHMNAAHTLTFSDGSTLVTSDEILLQDDEKNPGWVRANSRLYVVAGSGRYAGATGLLHTHGEVNLFTLEGSIDFKGRVCVP